MPDVLKNASIDYIDWLKIDTQGTDLRLFKSIPENIKQHILVAEFEPGIIDAYKGEDKLHELIAYMSGLNSFFMSSIDVKGVQKINHQTLERFSIHAKNFARTQRISPGWGEVSYMNTMAGPHNTRDYLLAFAFALVETQYGFALEIAELAERNTSDVFFSELKKYALKKIAIRQRVWPFHAMRNKLNKAINLIFD